MINYVLLSNHISQEKPNARCARVVSNRSYTEADVAETIAQRNIGINKAEALAMMEAITEIEYEWLQAGYSVKLRMMHLHPTIPGLYEAGEYPHEATIRITPSKETRKIARQIKLNHVESALTIDVNYVYDQRSDTTNDKVSSGGIIRITGHNIKIEGVLPQIGVEFLSLENPKVTYRIPTTDFIVNRSSEIIAIAPQMTAGEKVQMRITTQFSHSSKPLKTPRSICCKQIFTIV
jgi:urease gamma subunit